MKYTIVSLRDATSEITDTKESGPYSSMREALEVAISDELARVKSLPNDATDDEVENYLDRSADAFDIKETED